MKLSHISPDIGILELTLMAMERPQALLTLDMGIPNWPVWNLRVPMDNVDGEKILDMAVQAMAEDVLQFLLVMHVSEDVSKETFSKILMAYELIKGQNAENDGDSSTYRAGLEISPEFINETHSAIVTAAAKRNQPATGKSVRRMEVIRPVPKTRALQEAQQVIKKYRNRSLKGQPRPMFLLVYDYNGRPVGVKRL